MVYAFSALNSMVDCVTGFERILRTPIPLAYSVHLHHATWIYLLTLPSQLVEGLGWGTACAVSLAAFCLLGVLEIGWEIENPFGRDCNDLVSKILTSYSIKLKFCKILNIFLIHLWFTATGWLLSGDSPWNPENYGTKNPLHRRLANVTRQPAAGSSVR